MVTVHASGDLGTETAGVGRASNRHGRIARIRASRSAVAQALLKEAVALWQSAGLTVAGLIEETHGLPDRICNAGVLRDVVTGEAYSIYLDELAPGKICHIDASGASRACAAIRARIEQCDLVVLSKFGKLEAAQGGLFPAFAAAMAARTPVLTTVSAKHLSSFDAFAPDAAVLTAEFATLEAWRKAVERA
jgi:hypothetical protein